MAKSSNDSADVFRSLANSIRSRHFSPVYLLMGEEQFYIDRLYSMLMDTVLDETEKDFNLTVLYGSEASAADIVNAASRFPMMSEYQLVIVREAQQVRKLEDIAGYVSSPLPSTVLVLCYMGKSLDKRTSLYKEILKRGAVMESSHVRDYELPSWITSYFSSEGYQIQPEAAALLAESAGTDLNKISLEAGKIFKSMPEGVKEVTVKDVEDNVGITRQFSVFELTRSLSYKDPIKSFRIASYLGEDPKFSMPAAVNALFLHFFRVLKYHAMVKRNRSVSPAEVSKAIGVNPFFMKEYDAARKNYPETRCMSVISEIKEYDFRSKGGDAGEATQKELLLELVSKILSK